MNTKTWFVLGASLGALAVAAGAFGDHSLPRYYDLTGAAAELRSDGRRWWETASRYQMYHALALLAVAWLVDGRKAILPNLAGLAMFLGTLIFSGCLYAMGLTGLKVLGAVVPLGGALLIAGWVMLGLAGANLAQEERVRKKGSLTVEDSGKQPLPVPDTDKGPADPGSPA